MDESWFNDILRRNCFVNVQYDLSSGTLPTPDLANGDVYGRVQVGGEAITLNGAAAGGASLRDIFTDVLVVNNGSTSEVARWILTNMAHLMPMEWTLSVKDYLLSDNSLVATNEVVVTLTDAVTHTMEAPANQARQVDAVTDFKCPA